jgi:hypothetical protein
MPMPHEVTKDYAERERLKRHAWALWQASTDTDARVRAVELVIEAHWHRSREGCETTHPDLATFAAHWLDHGGYAWYDPVDAAEVSAQLRRRYPAPTTPHIPPGRSYWQPCKQRHCAVCRPARRPRASGT